MAECQCCDARLRDLALATAEADYRASRMDEEAAAIRRDTARRENRASRPGTPGGEG